MDAPTLPEGGAPRGFLATLLGIYFAPGESYRALLKRPIILPALAGLVALNLAFTAVWMGKVDAQEFMKAQMEEQGSWDKIPAESRGEALEQQGKALPYFAWGGAVLGAPIFTLLVAVLYLFIFRFFYASELSFKQSLSMVAVTFLAIGLVTSPLTLLTLFLKDDWTINPQTALQANLGAAVERDDVPKALYALLESLDVFGFWLLGLLAIAYAASSRRSTGAALWGVAAPWALYVAGKVAWHALF
jgi:hypothetical protein